MQTKVVHANGKCLNKIYEKKRKKINQMKLNKKWQKATTTNSEI